MKRLRMLAQIVLPLLAVAAVIAAMMWRGEDKKPAGEADPLADPRGPGPDAAPLAEPASPASLDLPPLGPRPAAQFPDGEPWQAGSLRGTQWKPVRPQKAWLVVAPAAGEQAEAAAPLLRNLWSSRDIAAVLLAAPPTPTQGSGPAEGSEPADANRLAERLAADARWDEALQGLLAEHPEAMVVLLGSGAAGEAALRWAADPRVLAVAALDAGAELPWLADQAWRNAAAKKHLWLGGPSRRADAADRLSRGLPHARVVARGEGAGLQWLTVADQRAALSGWLASTLGR